MIAFPWTHGDTPPGTPTVKRRILRFVWRHLSSLTLFVLIAAFAAVVILPHMLVTVPSGQVGVVWNRFGGGTELDPRYLRNEGLAIILPWDKIFLYELRIQSKTESYNAISSDGVNLTSAVNIRFRLRREFIPQVHQAIGPDYVNLLGPEVASRLREVISQYTSEQVYSTERQKIQEEIKNRVIERLGERFLERDGASSYRVPFRDVGVLYDTLLHEITLPTAVVAAINRKAEQFYIAQEYIYRVDRERKESERKKIEAEGIRDFQETVSQGISESYLRWRGIEATLELARSNNAKVVIIGGGKDGLPVILGNVDGPSPSGLAMQPGASRDATTPPAGTTSSTSAAGDPRSSTAGGAAPATGASEVDNFLARLWNRSTPSATPPSLPKSERVPQ